MSHWVPNHQSPMWPTKPLTSNWTRTAFEFRREYENSLSDCPSKGWRNCFSAIMLPYFPSNQKSINAVYFCTEDNINCFLHCKGYVWSHLSLRYHSISHECFAVHANLLSVGAQWSEKNGLSSLLALAMLLHSRGKTAICFFTEVLHWKRRPRHIARLKRCQCGQITVASWVQVIPAAKYTGTECSTNKAVFRRAARG